MTSECKLIEELRVQVHDARLVATMHVHGIGNMLTLNGKDFHWLSGISVLSLEEMLAFLG